MKNNPRYRLSDTLQLRRGDQVKIAIVAHCHPSTVSAVLNGKQAQDSRLAVNIIRIAEDYARRNKYRQ